MDIFHFFQSQPTSFICFIAFIGLLLGSFLNVVIYRLPKPALSLLRPASSCPHCYHPILARDNIPLLSYCLLKGRCRHCHTHISFRYPLVELFTCLASVIIALRFGLSISTVTGLMLTWALIALSFIDIDHLLLPDDITLPMIWMGLFLSTFSVLSPSLPTPENAILGAVLGYLSLFSVYWLFKWITGKEGMGFGDFKLLAMLGAWLGWQALPFIVFVASLLGVLIGGFFMLIKKQNHNTPIPFGPYLAFAGFLALLLGQYLNSLYLWMLF